MVGQQIVNFLSVNGQCWVKCGSILGQCWVNCGPIVDQEWLNPGPNMFSMMGHPYCGQMVGQWWINGGSIVEQSWSMVGHFFRVLITLPILVSLFLVRDIQATWHFFLRRRARPGTCCGQPRHLARHPLSAVIIQFEILVSFYLFQGMGLL